MRGLATAWQQSAPSQFRGLHYPVVLWSSGPLTGSQATHTLPNPLALAGLVTAEKCYSG